MSHEHETERRGLGRRGALAALLGTAAVATAATEARAAPKSNVRTIPGLPAGSPITTTIASAPIPGYAYRTLLYIDFHTLDPSSQARTFGGSGGAYGASVLEASIDIPAGALFRDVEWYVANSSGSNAFFSCALWTPTDGYITTFAPTTIPSGSGSPTATRTLVPSDVYGPYPDGAKLILYAPTASNVLLNGVRVGFINGGLEYYLRPVPVTVYDSTVTGGKLALGETRTVAITGGGVVPSTTGVVLRVTATGATSPGVVKIYPGNQTAPVANAIPIIASLESVGEVTVMLPSNRTRQVKIAVTRAAHIRLDLVGSFR